MFTSLKHVFKGKITLAAGVVGLAAAISVMLVPTPVTNATARKCHVFSPVSAWYEAGLVTSKEYTVPSSSECLDINVRNIKNSDPALPSTHPDKYCATFKVAMYPRDKTKPTYYSTPKRVCSKDPSSSTRTNGPVMVLATNVKNGTKYRILYQVTDPTTTIKYQAVD